VILRSILCAVDFSGQSQHALRWAAALAMRYDASLVVLTAVDPLLAEAARVRARLDLAKEEVEPALREFVSAVVPERASWAPATNLVVRVGDAADVILAEAGRQQADLVVLGTQGLGGFRKLLLGSTAEQVLRRTRTPVLSVPPERTDGVVIDAHGARLQLERILVATDFSAAAAAALRWAVTAASRLSVPIVLAHVVQETNVPTQWRPYAEESDERRTSDARGQLQQLARDACSDQTCDIVVTAGRPAEAIAAVAQDRHAGLIVMGLTSEQGPFARRPGSIAYPILSDARVPVVVVPGPIAEAQR
jgi:nucleotide-binding universal stress UspA family protein